MNKKGGALAWQEHRASMQHYCGRMRAGSRRRRSDLRVLTKSRRVSSGDNYKILRLRGLGGEGGEIGGKRDGEVRQDMRVHVCE